MIIKNNFNEKSIDPLKDYQKIGKKDEEFEKHSIKDNLNNQIIKDIIRKDNEYEEDDNDSSSDKWDFFR